MNNTILRLLGVLLAVVGTVPSARGQQIPPIQEGDPIVRATLTNNRLTMVDVENNFPIMQTGGLVFSRFDPAVTGNAELHQQPDGFDIVYTFTNTGNQPARMGRLALGKFNLGNNIHWRDFRHTGEPMLADYNTYSFQAFTYPNGLYSPVWELYNDQYAIGISLQYPVMTYRHDARLMLGSTAADAASEEDPRGWFIEYRLANLGDENPTGRLAWPGTLDPGETRTYVISVRVTKQLDEWIRTFIPYRDYFRSMYGGVRYQRDAHPVRPIVLAFDHLVSQANPYGFENFQHRRPDLYGFRPWTDHIKAGHDQWSRVMLWAPTGLYNQHRDRNYPFQFTTRWESEPQEQSVFDEAFGLPSVAASGMKVGLWWGRACQVSAAWNSGDWQPLDPDNPAHVQAAFAEMDLAVRAGATEIGLDTFMPRYCPIWKLEPWLQRMRDRYPNVKFIIEPVTCDILHRLGPTWVCGWTAGPVNQESDLYDINNPMYLADLLLPGHETWAGFSYQRHRNRNYPVTPEIVQRDSERFASYGYVPVMFDDPPHPESIDAAESWLNTLPADVLRTSGWNTNYNGRHAYRRPDGQLVIVDATGEPPPRPVAPGNRRVAAWEPDAPSRPHAAGGHDAAHSEVTSDDDATPAPMAPAAPIERAKRKYHIKLTVHGADARKESAEPDSPARLEADELPGARNFVAVPASARAKPGFAKGAPSSGWLDLMARSGLLDQRKVIEALRRHASDSKWVEPDIVVVPSDK